MILKKEFVEELKKGIPENIKKLGIIYPEKQVGHIRFDRLTSSPNTFLLDTIYLMHLTDSYNNKIVLKFNYRDFDYVPGYPWQSSEYKFESIYFMPNQHDEFRYNKDLKLVSKYLHGLLRMHNHHFLAIKTKYPGDSNMLDVAAEWNSYHEKNPLNFFDDGYIVGYQVEKNGKKVKFPYIIQSDKSIFENKTITEVLNDITEGFDPSKIKFMQKCNIADDIIIEKNKIYLCEEFNIDINKIQTKNEQ
tara:strand:- start:81 stop:821 length:741 start_codon:yes stop_codon:yes gene_type:complete